jgi:hypothetical protein
MRGMYTTLSRSIPTLSPVGSRMSWAGGTEGATHGAWQPSSLVVSISQEKSARSGKIPVPISMAMTRFRSCHVWCG